ncbi:MAG TPA: hypothetical protein VFK43_06445, partial [Acidimicrobiales bacterium]|nr:hypothetical protein [Acidimicrobiales bacterium]
MSPVNRRAFLTGLVATPLLAARGGGGDDESADTTAPSTTEEPTTTTTAPPVVQPLTGVVHDGDPALLERPALVVKVDN